MLWNLLIYHKSMQFSHLISFAVLLFNVRSGDRHAGRVFNTNAKRPLKQCIHFTGFKTHGQEIFLVRQAGWNRISADYGVTQTSLTMNWVRLNFASVLGPDFCRLRHSSFYDNWLIPGELLQTVAMAKLALLWAAMHKGISIFSCLTP